MFTRERIAYLRGNPLACPEGEVLAVNNFSFPEGEVHHLGINHCISLNSQGNTPCEKKGIAKHKVL